VRQEHFSGPHPYGCPKTEKEAVKVPIVNRNLQNVGASWGLSKILGAPTLPTPQMHHPCS